MDNIFEELKGKKEALIGKVAKAHEFGWIDETRYKEIIDKGYKEVFTGLSDKLKKQLEDDEVGLGYSGYMFSYPDWFERKKSAYIALRDSLKQCEEFMDDIKSLL